MLADEELLELVQRQTFRYFWEGGHPVSGLALDRHGRDSDAAEAPVVIGGSGFGALALIVACERGWVTRRESLARLERMLDCLEQAPRYHGMYPHLIRGDGPACWGLSASDSVAG